MGVGTWIIMGLGISAMCFFVMWTFSELKKTMKTKLDYKMSLGYKELKKYLAHENEIMWGK